MSNMLEITLIKSTICSSKKQCAVVRGLGLRKMQQTVSLQDTPEIRGMVRKVSHMLKVK